MHENHARTLSRSLSQSANAIGFMCWSARRSFDRFGAAHAISMLHAGGLHLRSEFDDRGRSVSASAFSTV